MSLKYCPSISWEGVRKIMTNELGVQTSDEYKARNVACSNLLFVNIAVHPPPPPPKKKRYYIYTPWGSVGG